MAGPSLIFDIWSLYFLSSPSKRAVFLSIDSARLSTYKKDIYVKNYHVIYLHNLVTISQSLSVPNWFEVLRYLKIFGSRRWYLIGQCWVRFNQKWICFYYQALSLFWNSFLCVITNSSSLMSNQIIFTKRKHTHEQKKVFPISSVNSKYNSLEFNFVIEISTW